MESNKTHRQPAKPTALPLYYEIDMLHYGNNIRTSSLPYQWKKKTQLDGDEDVVNARIINHFAFSRKTTESFTFLVTGYANLLMIKKAEGVACYSWSYNDYQLEEKLKRFCLADFTFLVTKKRGKPKKKGRKALLTVSWSNVTVYVHHGYAKHTKRWHKYSTEKDGISHAQDKRQWWALGGET